MIGGSSGATGDAVFDFVPDGSANAETRNIISTTVCYGCHGEKEFHGHGGDRLTVQNCATCHLPGNKDPQSGGSLDLKVMIHKIHAGAELVSIHSDQVKLAGADGIIWDDPTTAVDESKDNKAYAIWGYNDGKNSWWKAEFPAIIENCQKCHQGTQKDVDNWKNRPSREACGSCHDDLDWVAGTNHAGGPMSSDDACSTCHKASGAASAVVESHDWTTKDARNIPEFDVTLSLSTPANGKYFRPATAARQRGASFSSTQTRPRTIRR
jgi:OmcA/MtrC family decaheme c-type cytochrome